MGIQVHRFYFCLNYTALLAGVVWFLRSVTDHFDEAGAEFLLALRKELEKMYY